MLGKNRTGTVSGKKHGEGIIGQEAMRLYKTQDLGYVRGMRNVVGKEVKTLEEKLKLDMGAQGRARKTVYIEDTDQMAKLMQQNMQDDAATDDEESEDKVDEPVTQAREANREKILAQHRLRLDNRLANATKRLEALSQAEQALDVQRAKMGKAPTVGGTNKDGKTFKIRQRKR